MPDGQGGAFLAWADRRAVLTTGFDIYAQHVLGNGQIAPGWPADGLAVCTAPGDQDNLHMLADGAGGAYLVWDDQRFGRANENVYAQHLDGGGALVAGWPANGLVVCTARSGSPYVTTDGQDGFIVAWQDGRDGSSEIFAQRLHWGGEVATGWPSSGARIVGGDGGGAIAGVVTDARGGAYVGWRTGHDPYESDWEVRTIRFTADGSIAAGWPAGGLLLTQGFGSQALTSVAADLAGGVLLAWYDQYQQPAVVYTQRLQAGGTVAPGWPATAARASDLSVWQDLFFNALAPDGSGGVYVVLQAFTGSGEHGYIQHLTAGGTPALGWPASAVALVTPAIFYAFQQRDFAITADGAGGAIVAWNDTRVIDGQAYQDQIYAQRYFGDGPTPALVSLVSAEALPDRVSLSWYDAARTLSLVAVQRRREGEDWQTLGSMTFDGTGRAQYGDRDVVAGARYAYRLRWTESGAERFSAETWVDVPVALTLALDGARPNPGVGPLSVAFTLPRAEPATLELLDVSGRQVLSREVGDLGAGSHVVRLGECGCTPPGLYWLRLAQAGRSLVKRAAVIR